MSAATLSALATTDAHRAFDAALGQIDSAIDFQFRHRRWSRQRREDNLAEARAATWAAWHGLLRRGKDPVAVGVAGIVANACRALRNGRAVGANRSVGRGAMDIHHWKARRATGLRVVSFEEAGDWRDCLGTDRRYGPADEAAFRVDFAAWLALLPPRRRRVAELLAEGMGTGEVAGRLGVTAGAISQARE
jgi:DNA-directed RNA polymerase specialized sigma24 family protein